MEDDKTPEIGKQKKSYKDYPFQGIDEVDIARALGVTFDESSGPLDRGAIYRHTLTRIELSGLLSERKGKPPAEDGPGTLTGIESRGLRSEPEGPSPREIGVRVTPLMHAQHLLDL